MAIPMTADQYIAALRAEGLTVVEVGSWRTHNRNHKGPWGPVNGVMIHHTVTKGAAYTVELCRTGHSSLPGPLCHGVITKDGVVHVVSIGRANHAGGGDPNVLQAVIDERYTTRPPVPRMHDGSAGAVDGNAHFYGYECENEGDGEDPWPDVQVEAIVRVSAAHCRFHRWTEKSTIGHSEWSDWKTDPRGPDGVVAMPNLRARIKERLAHSASWNPNRQGPTMTAPLRTFLTRPQDVTLLKDVPHTLYWTSEHDDSGSQHGDGGKTVATAVQYSGVLNLTILGLESNEHVEVYAIEENSSGVQTGAAEDVDQIIGRDGAFEIRKSIPVMGKVYERLAFQVVNRAEAPAILTQASLKMQSWPNG